MMFKILQMVVGLLTLSLSMLRDCKLHLESYRISTLVIGHINLASVFIIAAVNIIISGFGVYPTEGASLRTIQKEPTV